MKLTEAQARKKWCPFARVADHNGVQVMDGAEPLSGYSYNRNLGGQPVDEARCLGSNCMAWRIAENVGYEDARATTLPLTGWALKLVKDCIALGWPDSIRHFDAASHQDLMSIPKCGEVSIADLRSAIEDYKAGFSAAYGFCGLAGRAA